MVLFQQTRRLKNCHSIKSHFTLTVTVVVGKVDIVVQFGPLWDLSFGSFNVSITPLGSHHTDSDLATSWLHHRIFDWLGVGLLFLLQEISALQLLGHCLPKLLLTRAFFGALVYCLSQAILLCINTLQGTITLNSIVTVHHQRWLLVDHARARGGEISGDCVLAWPAHPVFVIICVPSRLYHNVIDFVDYWLSWL